MTRLVTAIERLVCGNEGQDLIEYGLLAALIALVAVAGISAVGGTIYNVFWQGIGNAV